LRIQARAPREEPGEPVVAGPPFGVFFGDFAKQLLRRVQLEREEFAGAETHLGLGASGILLHRPFEQRSRHVGVALVEARETDERAGIGISHVVGHPRTEQFVDALVLSLRQRLVGLVVGFVSRVLACPVSPRLLSLRRIVRDHPALCARSSSMSLKTRAIRSFSARTATNPTAVRRRARAGSIVIRSSGAGAISKRAARGCAR